MLETIEFHSPTTGPSDRRRASESGKEAKAVAQQVIIQMVRMGWRECEAALALADALDDYCLYLAERPPKAILAANSNETWSHPSNRATTDQI